MRGVTVSKFIRINDSLMLYRYITWLKSICCMEHVMKNKREKEISLCLTADICNAIFPEHKDIKRWDMIFCAGIALEERLSEITDDFGNSPGITWFVRADPMMRRHFGSSTFLFERYGVHLGRFVSRGHEIGWHPHLDVRNLKSDLRELSEIASKVRDYFPVTSVRIGEAFHSSELMKMLDDLDFSADSTALPGRRNSECRTPFDWSTAPSQPYYPDERDYRMASSVRTMNLMEIPFTMLPIKLPDDRPGPAFRYMNFSYRREHFLSGVMAKQDWPDFLVGITHPAELAPPLEFDKTHRLLSFDESIPSQNIRFLLDRLRSIGVKIRFRTMKDAENCVREKENTCTLPERGREIAGRY
jgi:hypothetical protein